MYLDYVRHFTLYEVFKGNFMNRIRNYTGGLLGRLLGGLLGGLLSFIRPVQKPKTPESPNDLMRGAYICRLVVWND